MYMPWPLKAASASWLSAHTHGSDPSLTCSQNSLAAPDKAQDNQDGEEDPHFLGREGKVKNGTLNGLEAG